MNDTTHDIKTLLIRDLSGMQAELLAYETESDIWSLAPGINNSAGTLVLHCVGNLRHFIGAALGHTGYQRDRDGEFSARDLPREALVSLLDEAKADVSAGLSNLGEADLRGTAGLPGGKSCTRERFLHHLCTHLTYHLGQVDFHRRLITGSGALDRILGLGALDPGE